MKITKSWTEYESLLKSLEDERVVKVTYFDNPDELGQFHPDWYGKPFHNINYGIGFHTAANRLIALIWGQQFAQYGIDLIEIPIDLNTGQPKVDLFDTSITFDVSTLPEWSNIIGKCIRSSNVYWSWTVSGTNATNNEPADLEAEVPKHLRTYYPQDIVMTFETGYSCYISAAMYMAKDDRLLGLSDEITILFDKEAARHYHVGPYMRPYSSHWSK